MSRALVICALLTGAFVALATGSGWYLLGNTQANDKQSPPATEAANANDQVPKEPTNAPDGTTAAAVDNPRVSESSGEVAKSKTDETSKAAEAAKPATAVSPVSATKDTPERRQLLEVLGALTASHCYQTYLNIGLIADGKAKGTYTEKDAYKLLDSVLALVSSVDRELSALDRIELEKEDRASLEQMRTLSILLRKQAKELQIFWDTGKDEDAARYESVRKDTWAALSRLTGVAR